MIYKRPSTVMTSIYKHLQKVTHAHVHENVCVCVQLSLPGLCASGSQLIACIARYPSCRRIWSHCQLYWTVVAQGLTWLRSWQRYDDRHGSGINHRARACSECGSAANVSRSYVTKWGLFEYMVMQMVMTSGRHASNGLRVRSGK